jgi:hypothetical protein
MVSADTFRWISAARASAFAHAQYDSPIDWAARPCSDYALMNLILDPSLDDGRTVSAAFVVLAEWYAAHSAIRRLWAIKESQGMRVIVTLEPTHDGNDIYPAWLANGNEWAHELEMRIGGPMQLEVTDEPLLPAGVGGGVLVAELFWRDPSALAD